MSLNENLPKNFWDWRDLDTIFRDVVNERHRQLHEFGIQTHENGTSPIWQTARKVAMEENRIAAELDEKTWAWLLLEQVYSALSEEDFTKNLRHELIQAAAVIFAWVEDLDTRT